MGKKNRLRQQRRIEGKSIRVRVFSGPEPEELAVATVEDTPREAESCSNSLLQYASINEVVSQMDLEKPKGRCTICGKEPASKILKSPHLTGTFLSCGSLACECAVKMLYNDVHQRYHTTEDQYSFLKRNTFGNVEEDGEVVDVEVEEMLRNIEITDSTSVRAQDKNAVSVSSKGKQKNLTIDPLSAAKNMSTAVQAVKEFS